MTVQVACDRWWDEVGSRGNDPDLRRALNWLAEQIGPKVALHDITDDTVSRAVEARRAQVMRSGLDAKGVQLYRPVSPRTVNKTVTDLLSRVMNRARENWFVIIGETPIWKNHKLKVIKRPVREITLDEDAALDGVESEDYALLREFAEIMGLRRREILMTWHQVDLAKRTISIIGKGHKHAILPLSNRAHQILLSRKGHHETWVFTFTAQKNRVCGKTKRRFVKGQRYPMTYDGLSTNKRRKWAKAGVHARWHDLRHTTGQRTLRATGNLRLTQELLRHSRIDTTSRFYTAPGIEDLRAGMELTESQKKSQSADTKTLKVIDGKGE